MQKQRKTVKGDQIIIMQSLKKSRTFGFFSRAKDNLSHILWAALQTLTAPPGRRSYLHGDQAVGMTEAVQFWELAPRNGNKPTLQLKITGCKIRQCCSDHWWPISRWLSELIMLCLHVAPSLSLPKFLLTACQGRGCRESALRQAATSPPPTGSQHQDKASFLFPSAWPL